MIFVDNKVEDILYLLNLQIASFKNDAIPSKPVLYNVVFNTNDVNEIQPK
jgi:arylformamidase